MTCWACSFVKIDGQEERGAVAIGDRSRSTDVGGFPVTLYDGQSVETRPDRKRTLTIYSAGADSAAAAAFALGLSAASQRQIT